jgi:hypothetical protein
MAITSLDQLINGFSLPVNFIKQALTSEGAGTYHSTWRASGTPGSGMLPPNFSGLQGSYVCDNTTTGAMYLNGITGFSQLARFGCCNSIAGNVILYDRIKHIGNFSMNLTTLQTVSGNDPMPPRDAFGTDSGIGCEIWGEIFAAGGATAATWQVIYTNSAGVTGKTGLYAHPNNAESVGQMFPFVLANGDRGVSGISAVRTSATATPGNLGIVILRRIAENVSPVAGFGTYQDAITLGLPPIYPSSCLSLMHSCTTTTAGQIVGAITLATG